MSRVSEAFKKRKALITFITAGDPSLRKTEELVLKLERSGADIIELGIPFSDPLADGPVIQDSHARALKNNVGLSQVFGMVKKIRKKSRVPIVFMLAENLVEQYGTGKFYSDCEESGVDGVIVPDLPVEEEERVERRGESVDNIQLIAPSTKEERIKRIVDAASGFVYLVSVMGVTGKRTGLSAEVSGMIKKVKRYTDKPVAVGFGISTPAHVNRIKGEADGVIVGSAIVDLIGKQKYNKALELVSSMRRALDA